MQIFVKSRRRAALLPLALAFLLAPVAAMAVETQAANVMPIISLSTPGEGFVEPPRQVRSDLLLASDGNVYFGSFAGGKGTGAIARLTPDGVVSTLYSFKEDGTEGVNVLGPLLEAGGALYGTTYFGGAEGGGTLFRVTLDGAFTLLHSFGGGHPNPILPYTGVALGSDGLLYGTTLNGGNDNKGTIYRVATDGTGFTVLHEFDGGSGENPEGTLIAGADGLLYGTTLLGGASNRGTIYRISTSGAHEVLFSFPPLGAFNNQGLATNATGANPRAGLLLAADGNFYGTAYQGGEFGHGSVFRFTPAGQLSVFYSFRGPSFDGSGPLAAVTQDAAGNFYGTTERGGYLHRGSAYRLAPDGSFSLLHSFSGSSIDGQTPYAGVRPAHGKLYGASYTDSVGGAGAIMAFDTGTGGVLPVTFSVSAAEIPAGSSVTFTWNAPAAATCTKTGGTLDWTGTTTPAGTQNLTLFAGTYSFGLTCSDPDDGNEATPLVARAAYTAVVATAPPLEPVDGGGGAGSLSLAWLLLAATLLYLKFLKENRSSCP